MQQQPSLRSERKMNVLRPVDWSRAYRDWRVLTAIAVVLVIVVTYLMTGDLSWRPQGGWHRDVNQSDKHGTDLPPVTDRTIK